jgi:hypothetical protein
MSVPETGAPPPERPASSPEPPRAAPLAQVIAAVFWSFFGVRKRAAMTTDATRIRPWQVILVGIALAALFVGTLVTIVRIVVATAG